MKIRASKVNENQWLIKVRKANILFQMSEKIAAWTLFPLWLDVQPAQFHSTTVHMLVEMGINTCCFVMREFKFSEWMMKNRKCNIYKGQYLVFFRDCNSTLQLDLLHIYIYIFFFPPAICSIFHKWKKRESFAPCLLEIFHSKMKIEYGYVIRNFFQEAQYKQELYSAIKRVGGTLPKCCSKAKTSDLM